MTERLSQLLHEEATRLDVPVPDHAGLALEGRRLRRRSHLRTGLSAAAAVAVVAVGSVTVWQAYVEDGRPDVAAELPRDAVIYGWEDQVHLDDVSVEVPGSVTGVDLTSRGVLVTSQNPATLTLVRYDGTSVDLGSAPELSPVETDPASAVYVHNEWREGTVVVVARDVETGEVVREVPTIQDAGRADTGAPLTLDGDTVYLGLGRTGMLAIDLTTGDTREIDRVAPGLPGVQGGRWVVGEVRSVVVVDVATGEDLLTLPRVRLIDTSLSPDGRWLVTVRDTRGTGVVPLEEESPPEVTVHDVDSGEQVTLDPADSGTGWAWTSAGELYRIDGDEVVRCDPSSGSCERTPAPASVPDYGIPSLPGVPSS